MNENMKKDIVFRLAHKIKNTRERKLTKNTFTYKQSITHGNTDTLIHVKGFIVLK